MLYYVRIISRIVAVKKQLRQELFLDLTKHCELEYGAYAQVHQNTERGNNSTDIEQTTYKVCLGPTGNKSL